MRFCLFLVDEGVITDQQCVDVLRVLCQRTPPLGRLILKSRMVSLTDLRRLVAKQMLTGGMLGQLAVAEGLLTERQLADLLDRQRRETPDAGQLVVELGMADTDTVKALHRKFVELLS